MSWSYSGNPAASSRDAVRFAIGDTLTSDQQITDEEIDFVLSTQPSITLAAIECCDHLIGLYARLVSQSVGSISVSYAERQKNYVGLRRRLAHRLAPVPYAGGISIADKTSNEEDTDWDYPSIYRGMDKRSS